MIVQAVAPGAGIIYAEHWVGGAWVVRSVPNDFRVTLGMQGGFHLGPTPLNHFEIVNPRRWPDQVQVLGYFIAWHLFMEFTLHRVNHERFFIIKHAHRRAGERYQTPLEAVPTINEHGLLRWGVQIGLFRTEGEFHDNMECCKC
jgi:hypothetical protein